MKHKPFPKGAVMSFYADNALRKKIKIHAVKLDKDTSFIIRLALRKFFGLRNDGSL